MVDVEERETRADRVEGGGNARGGESRVLAGAEGFDVVEFEVAKEGLVGEDRGDVVEEGEDGVGEEVGAVEVRDAQGEADERGKDDGAVAEVVGV